MVTLSVATLADAATPSLKLASNDSLNFGSSNCTISKDFSPTADKTDVFSSTGGDTVGAEVGDTVGCCVGDSVGGLVGDSVGAKVGACVGVLVGTVVGNGVSPGLVGD